MKLAPITHPSSVWLALAGLVVTLAILGAIAYTQLTEHTARVPDAAPQVLDETSGACTADRLRLACTRATDAGWPSCYVAPGLGAVVSFGLIPPPADAADGWKGHGATALRADGRTAIILDVDHATCADDDLTLEHELICHLYGVGHVGLTGSLCASTASQAGTRIPRRRE